MTEKNFQTYFGKYLKEHPPSTTEVYELKICKGNSLPFNAVKPHQIQGLLQAKIGLYHKITDFPIFAGSKMRFNRVKPFDCMCFNQVTGFVVIWFYKPREKKIFYKIPIEKFLKLKKEADRKSMTEEMVEKVGIAIQI